MRYDILGSSSNGNCIIVNNTIMLDCGLSYAKIKPYLKNIKLIFISHLWLHSDHCKNSTIKKIAFEYPNIKFITSEVNAEHLVKLGVKKQNIYALKLEKWYNIGLCKVRLDYLIHDKPNCSLKINQNGYKLIYIVDTSSVEHIEAKDYDMAFIEGNYTTDDELIKKIEKAYQEGKYTHYERVLNTHLSQLQALNFIQKNNIKDYVFIHQHKTEESENIWGKN